MNGKAIRVLIVDDEKLARKRLTRFLRAQPDVAIVGICANGPDAIEAIERTTPDVVFLDVQMPNLDGFELLSQLPAKRIPRVVFVTAYDEYAVRAFEVGALDYLLKPFDQARFEQAFHRVRNEMGEASTIRRSACSHFSRGRPPPRPSRVAPSSTSHARPADDQERRARLSCGADIRWAEAADTCPYPCRQGLHLFRQTLNAIEQGLDPRKFMRIHRSTLVNLDCVREIQEGVGREHFVVLEDGTRLRLSDRYRRRLEERSLPPC
jgi:two-component system LytT family response regulator